METATEQVDQVEVDIETQARRLLAEAQQEKAEAAAARKTIAQRQVNIKARETDLLAAMQAFQDRAKQDMDAIEKAKAEFNTDASKREEAIEQRARAVEQRIQQAESALQDVIGYIDNDSLLRAYQSARSMVAGQLESLRAL